MFDEYKFMVRKFITILIITFCSFSYSQISFQKAYSGYFGRTILQTSDSGYVFISRLSDSLTSAKDITYLVKTNQFGDTIWTKTYSTTLNNVVCNIVQTADGGFAFAGYSAGYSTAGITYYSWLVRTNSFGDTLWTKKYVSINETFARSMQQTSDGGFIMAGSAIVSSNEDYLLMKTDSLGNLQWSRKYGAYSMDRPSNVIEVAGSGYIISGLSQSFGGGDEIYIVKTDLNGNLIWSKTYGGASDDLPFCTINAHNNQYVVLSLTRSFNGLNEDFYLLKIDSSGNLVWSKVYDVGLYDSPSYITSTNDNGYIITGTTIGGSYTMKVNSIGDTVWAKNIDISTSYGNCLTKTFDNGYAFLSYRYNTPLFGNCIIKTDSLATSCTQTFIPVNIISHTTSSSIATTTTSLISFSVSSIPMLINSRGKVTTICNPIGVNEQSEKHNFIKIYPNPNNGSFSIEMSDSISENNFELFNIFGQKVLEQKISNGQNKIITTNLASGLYNYLIHHHNLEVIKGKLIVE